METIESKEARPSHAEEKGSGPDYANAKFVNEEAALATANEHSLSLWQALKTYKKAALWSIRKFSEHIMLIQTLVY